MPISKKHNCIFIHIPKTAGTSIESALGMHGSVDFVGIKPYLNQVKNKDTLFGGGLQHLTAAELKKTIKDYDSYFKFSFVRNPWDRFVSAAIFNGSLMNNRQSEISKNDFEKIVKKTDYSKPHFRPQLDYININGNVAVDFLGKFENLHQDIEKISKLIGVKIDLPHRMKTNHRHYAEYYNEESRQIISQKYAKDIDSFGYKFEKQE